jgi:hypothetical protein
MEALIRNIGSCCFDVKGEIQAENLQELNTDAKRSGGLIGSSVEVPVMGMEQSDQIIRLIDLINHFKMEGINAKGKVIYNF